MRWDADSSSAPRILPGHHDPFRRRTHTIVPALQSISAPSPAPSETPIPRSTFLPTPTPPHQSTATDSHTQTHTHKTKTSNPNRAQNHKNTHRRGAQPPAKKLARSRNATAPRRSARGRPPIQASATVPGARATAARPPAAGPPPIAAGSEKEPNFIGGEGSDREEGGQAWRGRGTEAGMTEVGFALPVAPPWSWRRSPELVGESGGGKRTGSFMEFLSSSPVMFVCLGLV